MNTLFPVHFIRQTPAQYSPQLPLKTTPTFAAKPKAVKLDMQQTYNEAQKTFGFKLFQKVLAQPGEADKNVFLSPASVSLALGMTYNGAQGKTKTDMGKALETHVMPLTALNVANENFMKTLETIDPKVTLNIANSLWASPDARLKSSFVKRNQNAYRAELTQLNFRTDPKGSENKINQWVNTKTQGMIPDIVKDVNPDTILYLVNAIFFKGDWTTAFDPKLTNEQGKFTNHQGQLVTLPLMKRKGDFQYQETAQFQAIKLPYGSGKMSMVVMLPKPGVSLDSLQTQLSPQSWDIWMRGLSYQPGTIILPRFKQAYKIKLNDTLKAMGMGIAFDPKSANFRKMATLKPNEQLFISTVDHKTALEVEEKGTKAAAATAVGMVRLTTAMPVAQPKPFHMEVNRPFLLTIQDNQTNIPLFIGSIKDPTAKN